MTPITAPYKPFPNYKWRWATFQPTESLNDPPVFLGVLRVFNRFQNHAPASKEVMDALLIVQNETNTNVDLVRTQERNLVRNSGQYWKALGLLEEAHGRILVSPFGELLANGKITQVEFAATVIKTLELPNRRIVDDTSDWDKVGLRIKPLELILDILAKISIKYGPDQAYITPFELRKIIIPLAGNKVSLDTHADSIFLYRNDKLDISNWPDCAPNANDKRIAREFLLFLSNYGFCTSVRLLRGNDNEKYFLASISKEEIKELHEVIYDSRDLVKVARVIRETQIPTNVERKRVTREVLERPHQNAFRKNILAAFNSKCIITGVVMESVLEASHIRDVKYNGSDRIENGLCLRSDIHQLFDSHHLMILPNGQIILSELAAARENYFDLPREIELPGFINRDHLHWRYSYT